MFSRGCAEEWESFKLFSVGLGWEEAEGTEKEIFNSKTFSHGFILVLKFVQGFNRKRTLGRCGMKEEEAA